MPTRLWRSRCERSTKLAEPSQGRLKRALPRVAPALRSASPESRRHGRKAAQSTVGARRMRLTRSPSRACAGLTVGPGDDQGREGEDDNDVADDGGHAWVKGGTFPCRPSASRPGGGGRRDAQEHQRGHVMIRRLLILLALRRVRRAVARLNARLDSRLDPAPMTLLLWPWP